MGQVRQRRGGCLSTRDTARYAGCNAARVVARRSCFHKREAPNLTSSLVAIADTPSSVRVHGIVLDGCWVAGYWFFKKRKNSLTLKLVVWLTAFEAKAKHGLLL